MPRIPCPNSRCFAIPCVSLARSLINPILGLAVLVGDRDDVDVVAFNRVEQLVGEATQGQAADISPLDRARQGPRLDAWQGRLDFRPEFVAETGRLAIVVALCLLELAPRFGCKDHAYHY